MDSLWEQAEAARDETEKEKRRRAMEEFYRLKEENATLGNQLEENLTVEIVEKQDWSKIIRDVQNSRRHKVFYQGSSRDHQELYQKNYIHIINPNQEQWIIKQLKRWGSFKDEDYITRVALPEAIVAIYANYHKMPHEEANNRVSATLVNDNEGILEETEAAQLAREKEQKKQEDKAERKANKVKARERKQQLDEEKENKARPRFKFDKEDKQARVEGGKREKEEEKRRKETKLAKDKAEKARLEAEKNKKTEVEKEKKEKEEDKRRKEEEKEKIFNKKISSMMKERLAEEKRQQRSRAETLIEQKPDEPEIPVDVTEEDASVGGNSDSRYLQLCHILPR